MPSNQGMKETKFMTGINFWPRLSNIKMWKEWDEKSIFSDLEQAKNLGCRFIRIFLLDEDFVNGYGEINSESTGHLSKFLDECYKNGIKVFITFMVGHMSGRNWIIPWAPDNNIYDDRAIMNFSKFVEDIVMNYKEHPSIEGWIMTNEMSLVNKPSTKEQALVIESVIYGLLKRLDPSHLVSSGDVLSYLQHPPNISNHSDYSGLHLYFYDNNLIRQRYNYGNLLNVFSNDGQFPVFLEEFGFSTNQGSEDSQGDFIYSTLWTAFANNSIGALVWCFSDFPGEEDPPYDWRPLEINFGLVRSDGSLKPSAEKFHKFAEEVQLLENKEFKENFNHVPSKVSVIVPFYAYTDYFSVAGSYQEYLFNRIPNPILTSLMLSKMAHLQVSAFYENDLPSHIEGKSLLLIPSVPVMRATTWNALLSYAKAGNIHIMASTLRGSEGNIPLTSFHDSFTHIWEDLFGVKNTTQLGSKGVSINDNTDIHFVRSFGSFKEGDHIKLHTSGNKFYSYSIEPTIAEIIAIDNEKRPVLTYNHDTGAFLFSVPIELILSADDTEADFEPFVEIYKEIAKISGVDSYVSSNNTEIEAVTFVNKTSHITITINHSSERIQSTVYTKGSEHKFITGNASLLNVGKDWVKIDYPPGGVAVLESQI